MSRGARGVVGIPRLARARGGRNERGIALIEILVELGNRLGAGWTFDGEASVFRALAETEAPFSGMTYESIGMFGQEI